MMNVYVEPVVIIALIITLLFGRFWVNRTWKKALKEYDKEKDISRNPDQNDRNYKGGVFNQGRDATEDKRTNELSINSLGHDKSEGGELLQEAIISDVGEDSSCTRKNNSRVWRRLFGRRNKKK